ncbi:hypothetical protein Tco_0534869 [Tanacetum coccineum]
MWLMWIVMGLYIATDEASSPFCLALHFFQSSPHDFPIIGSSSMVRRITTVGHMDCQLAILDVDTLCSYSCKRSKSIMHICLSGTMRLVFSDVLSKSFRPRFVDFNLDQLVCRVRKEWKERWVTPYFDMTLANLSLQKWVPRSLMIALGALNREKMDFKNLTTTLASLVGSAFASTHLER